MSKNNGVRYSEEFKQQLVDLYNSGSSVSYLSREYMENDILKKATAIFARKR